MAFVSNGPLDVLTFGKIHGLSDGGREVDVPLLAFFALNELNFGWKTHMAISSHITRLLVNKKKHDQCVCLVTAKLQASLARARLSSFWGRWLNG